MFGLDFWIWFFAIIFIAAVLIFIILILKSPFKYPYFYWDFDVSGKRKPQFEDLIDNLLIAGKFELILRHRYDTDLWKKECEEEIQKSKIKNYRRRQYEECIDDENEFIFRLVRKQTRYRQQNYVKYSYLAKNIVDEYSFNYEYLEDRNNLLKLINYECTLNEYRCKNQRRLMTPELKKKIMIRDNYTCQKCGKYMPDEVGLHIDHIIPISKGGKSVPSNLQVLCSKCNGKKSNKI